VSTSPNHGQSGYRRRTSPDAVGQPLTVQIEFVVIDGPEGRELRQHQADVMRKVLEWIAQRRNEIP
jgi:hypothetical protein